MYQDKEEVEIRQLLKTKGPELISNIGGTMGLFLGISLLSFIEIIEFIFEIIFEIFHKKSGKILDSLNR